MYYDMIVYCDQGHCLLYKGWSLQVMFFDMNNKRMKSSLIVCPMNILYSILEYNEWFSEKAVKIMHWPECRFSSDFFKCLACCLAVYWWKVGLSILRLEIFNEFVWLLCCSYESCSVCRYTLFGFFCHSFSSCKAIQGAARKLMVLK